MHTSIVLADDHPLLLNGTKEYLEKKGHQVLDTAADGNEAYNKIVRLRPDVAILDVDMPKLNGLEVALEIKRKGLPTKVIILSLHKQEAILNEVGNSILGYVTKDSAMEELEDCLRAIGKNDTFISSKLRSNVQFDIRQFNVETLTPTEMKILKYLNGNLSSGQIADELFISKRTVEKHRSNIIKKLDIDTTNQNALYAWLRQHPEIFG
jgi:DNA-binding NarL/FixJ family response regulator